MHSALLSGAAELIAAGHYAKREIMELEEELPKWRTVTDTAAPPDRPSCTLICVHMVSFCEGELHGKCMYEPTRMHELSNVILYTCTYMYLR